MNSCQICFKTILNDKLYKTKCNHCFHKKCIKEWLQYSNRCSSCHKFIKKKFKIKKNDTQTTLVIKKDHILFVDSEEHIIFNKIKSIFRNGENEIYLKYKNKDKELVVDIIEGDAYRIFDMLSFKINKFNQKLIFNRYINNAIYE